MKPYKEIHNHDDLLWTVDAILDEAGLDRKDLGSECKLTFAGMDPIRPTSIKVGCASAAITGANAVASSLIWKMRSGEGQDIHLDLRKCYVSQSAWQDTLANCTLINNTPHMISGSVGEAGAHICPTKDGKFVVITSLYASNSERIMKLLNSGTLPRQLELASRKWDAAELEEAGQAADVPIAICRTLEEYKSTEQYKHNFAAPLIDIQKIGESPPEPLGPASRPLSGIRCLGIIYNDLCFSL